MNTTTTTAAAEAAKNVAIYNKLADIAREVFNHLTAEPGRVYTPADIAKAITGGPVVREKNMSSYICDRVEKYEIGDGLAWAEGYDPATVYEVAEGSFSCRVNGWRIWSVLDRCARAWPIATAQRVTFTAERAAAPVVASFTLTAAEGRELLACLSDDELRPVMCRVHLDTRRRVLVSSDGHVMRVINLGDRLTLTDTAAPYYNIDKSVIKAGRAVTITADNYATAAGVSAACFADVFPNWAAVLSGFISRGLSEAGRVALTPAQWKEWKKAIADVSKVCYQSKHCPPRVTVAHVAGENVAHVWAIDRDFNREREAVVSIDPAAPSFSIDTDARRWAKLAAPAALYVIETTAPLLMTDPAGLSLVMPLQPCESDKYYNPFTVAPAGGCPDLLPGLDLPAAAADITRARHLSAAVAVLENATATDTPDELAEVLVNQLGHIIDSDRAAELLTAARELMTRADEMTAREVIAAPAADIESEPTTAAPAADDIDTTTTAQGDTAAEWCPLTGQYLTPADHLTPDEIRAAAAAERDRIEREKAGTIARADVDTLAATYPGKTRAEILAELLTIDTDRAAMLLADIAAPAADIESESQNTTTTAEPVTIESEPTADPLPLLSIDTAAGVIVWGLADELPTADGMTADTVTPADLLAIESERADEPTAAPLTVAPAADIENDSESRPRALLLTICRAALRLAAVIVCALLITLHPDRPDTATAAPAADHLTATRPDTLTATTTAAGVLTIDTTTTAQGDTATATPRPLTAQNRATRTTTHHRRRSVPTATTAPDSIATTATPARALLTAADSIATPDSIDTTTTAADVLTTDTTATAQEDTAAPAADDIDTTTTAADVLTDTTATAQEDTAAPAADDIDTTTTATGTPDTLPAPAPADAPLSAVAPMYIHVIACF